MIKIAINPEENSSSEEIDIIINGISKFCLATKSFSQKKSLLRRKGIAYENGRGPPPTPLEDEMAESIDGINTEEFRKDDENRTLTDKAQSSPKPKIVRNVILFSSQELDEPPPMPLFGFLNLFPM
jgi:hypothetical protein